MFFLCLAAVANFLASAHPPRQVGVMRGYFGIGVERISKAMNVGTLFRSAHAFDASFVFTIDACYDPEHTPSDTAKTPGQLPFYEFASAADLLLPDGCKLVGIELMDDADELPSFRHPSRAAYVLGPERGRLSDGLLARCDKLVKIPTKFSINLGVCGAIVMYDRILTLGRHAARPVSELALPEPSAEHVYGEPRARSRKAAS
jgi:tRNA G18 (ribose-2'-O)-methylase SpoU